MHGIGDGFFLVRLDRDAELDGLRVGFPESSDLAVMSQLLQR